MKLILKVVVIFVVVALLLLLTLSWLEKREDNSPSAILEDLKDAGREAVDDVDAFLEESGAKDGMADLLEQGAALIGGEESPAPEASPEE